MDKIYTEYIIKLKEDPEDMIVRIMDNEEKMIRIASENGDYEETLRLAHENTEELTIMLKGISKLKLPMTGIIRTGKL